MINFANINPNVLRKEVWEKSPSKIQGYNFNYHCVTKEDDIINLDYNVYKRMVKISVRIAEEPNKEYVSILKGGVILQERETNTSHTVNLNKRLSKFGNLISQISNPDLLDCIGKNYNVVKKIENKKYFRTKGIYKKNYNLLNYLQNFLEKHVANRNNKKNKLSSFKKFLNKLYVEFMDIGIGALILKLGNTYFSFTELAIFSGFYGLFCGALDWFWRGENPFLPKIIFFIMISFVLVYIQVQYRMWGIYL